MVFRLILVTFFSLVGCTQIPTTPEQKATTALVPLSWESVKGANDWSQFVFLKIRDKHLSSFDKAKDAERFCPAYKSLNTDQKATAWAELISAMAKYESSWDPSSSSVDVGTSEDRDTWSVGLLQMSVIDQESYKLPLGFSFADLKKPLPNLELGLAILAQQIEKKGTVILSSRSGLYWAVLFEGGKYDKTAQIISMTKKIPFCTK